MFIAVTRVGQVRLLQELKGFHVNKEDVRIELGELAKLEKCLEGGALDPTTAKGFRLVSVGVLFY